MAHVQHIDLPKDVILTLSRGDAPACGARTANRPTLSIWRARHSAPPNWRPYQRLAKNPRRNDKAPKPPFELLTGPPEN